VSDLDATRLYQSANRVSSTFIRASADEMSYHLHILLRYELEAAMISGDLKVSDLKAAWNERSRSLLGIVPENDNDGVLQDGHWPAGMFGYFPTYTVGSLYAAQLAETYAKSQPLEQEISTGNFAPILGWLRKSIHEYGDRHTADELMEKATGKRLDPEAYFRHITAKFA
jgi:carboxypeptidase Taq